MELQMPKKIFVSLSIIVKFFRGQYDCQSAVLTKIGDLFKLLVTETTQYYCKKLL